MTLDISGPDHARAMVVLLHPHPSFGGDRFHPFIDATFRLLERIGVGAIRFDFSTADPGAAGGEVAAAIEGGLRRWPEAPVFLVGYSFGAGVAAALSDARILGWYLLAPQAPALTASPIGPDPRPKAIVVPELDQYSPPAAISQATEGWENTTVSILAGTDHFLGDVKALAEAAVGWVEARLAPA
jgi:alpha/beta superfamily hydrolase